MQTPRYLPLLIAAPLLVPVASGCMFLTAPPADPIATPAPTPKAPFFDPAAGQVRGPGVSIPLNAAGDAKLPDAFRIAGATSGDRVAIQSVNTVQVGKPPKSVLTIGAPDTVRLGGIVAPTTEPGLSLAKKTISDWTAGRDVDVDIDAKYPTDLNGVRVVHVFYKGREKGAKGEPGPFAGQTLSLNRMLVRSGNAVVDLYSPTAFDTSQWLLDEAYARRHKLGFWKFGVAIQQRIPINLNALKVKPGTIRPGNGASSTVSIVSNAAPVVATTQTTTTQSTTSVAPPAVAPGVAGSSIPSVSSSAAPTRP